MATKEQTAANRRNAKHSTGPKSPDGKAKTKLNGLKHGLRSREVVLPTEDPAEFRAFVDAWLADWNPPTMARRQLVEDAAAAAWRKRRCLRIEAGRLAERVRGARAEWDRVRADDVEDHVGRLADAPDEPAEVLAALMATREGVDRLVELWECVADSAAPGGWDDGAHFLYIALHGRCPGDDEVREVRDASWRLVLVDAPGMIGEDGPRPWRPAAAEAARREIAAEARGRIEALRALRATRPDEAAARDARAEVAAFAPRPKDAPLQRYEAQLSREFHRSLADLVKLTKSGDDLVEAEEEPAEDSAPSEANRSEVLEGERDSGSSSGSALADPSGSDEGKGPAGASEVPLAGSGGPIRGLVGVPEGPESGPDQS